MVKRSMAGVGLAVATVTGLLVATGLPAGAAPAKPRVTYTAGPEVGSDGSVSLAYSVNRQSKAIAARTCTVDTATTHTAVDCGALPAPKSNPTNVSVALAGLAAGTYTFTVRVTLTDGGKASATSPAFTVTAPAPVVDQANLFGPDPDEVGLDADGLCSGALTDFGQSFTAGRTGLLTQVSLLGTNLSGSAVVATIYASDPDGLPTGPGLGTGTYTGTGSSEVEPYFPIVLDEPVALTQGRQYAVTWTLADCATVGGRSTRFAGSGGTGDQYPGGTAFGGNEGAWSAQDLDDLDFYFQTWMT